MAKELKIQAEITPAAFREYSYFDAFRRQKRYKTPLLFLLIMAGFAGVCFAMTGRREHAMLLGCVLLGVGLGLPAAYFLSFFLSVRSGVRLLAQKRVPASYAVTLSSAGITIPAGGKTLQYSWDSIHYVYRIRRSTCVYVEAGRAYMLPLQDPETEARLWDLICGMLPPDKCFDWRK